MLSTKLEPLLRQNDNERLTWNGPHRRRALKGTLVAPRFSGRSSAVPMS
jgi:hypothetical protein